MIDYSKPIAIDRDGEKRPAKVSQELMDVWLIQDEENGYTFADENGLIATDYAFSDVLSEQVVNVPQSEVWVVLWRYEGDIRVNVFFRKPPPANKFEGFIKTVKVYEE